MSGTWGGYLAVIGGVFLIPSVVWDSFFVGSGYDFLSMLFVILGFLGVLLTTLGAVWVSAVIRNEGAREGSLWASLGVAVTLLSLAGLILYAVFFVSGSDSGRLFLTFSVLAWWVRPLGLILLAFALVRADILFGRALLLFLVAFLEIPILSNIFRGDSSLLTLLFVIPTLQSGLLAAAAWIAFGYSLLLLGDRDHRTGGDGDSPFISSPLQRP